MEDEHYMAQEEEAIRVKEDVETDNTLVPVSSLPKLNLRRLESIQRLLQYASALVLFVFIALIVVSYFKWYRTIEEIKLNEGKIVKQTGELKQQQDELSRQQDELSRQQEDLAKQNKTLEENQSTLDFQTKEIERLRKEYLAQEKAIDSLPEQQKNLVAQKIENNLTQGNNSKQAPGWIYIQIANKDQKEPADKIASQLKKNGFIVPGIENVGDKAPDNSEIRTCGKKDDTTTKQDLDELTAALKSLKDTLGKPKFLSNCGKANSRQYELWFGKNF